MSDTIAAIATPPGSGGVGVIRISGAAAAEVGAALVGQSAAWPDRQVSLAVARDAAGLRLDAVLVLAMRAPRSYTGEDVVEIHGHGGATNMAALLRRVLELGARSAEPGEFTRRAFENGKLDLTRAEAVIDVIEAGSERALRVAQAQLAGGLADRVRGLRDRAVALLAEQEASIDFPDEDLDLSAPGAVEPLAAGLADEVDALAESYALGRALRSGLSVAIVGPVNAGKSSLFNALVGRERAIVTAEPGTTRDFVEAQVVWQGIPVTLIDTAGLRDGVGEAERLGIELSRRRADEADLRLVVRSADAGPADVGIAPWGRGAQELGVATKTDLVREPAPAGVVATSAVSGAGLDELRSRVVARALGRPTEGDDGALVTNERQRELLVAASRALRAAAGGVGAAAPAEIIAIELRDGVERLSQVLGERVGDEVLDVLFSRFCIGK